MSGERRRFDWQKIHENLDTRLARLGSTYENDAARRQLLLRERSARLAMLPASRTGGAELNRFLVFVVRGERYAVALGCAQEIVRIARIAALPGSSTAVFGIINWRGEFVPTLDTARFLGLAPGENDDVRYALVMRADEPRVALAVDALDGIVRFDLAQLQPPDQLRSGQRDIFRGVARDAIVVLDENRLTERLNEELRAA